MKDKRGISKIAIILMVFIILILIGAGTAGVIWYLQQDDTPIGEVELYEDYVEGQGFVAQDEDLFITKMTPLEAGLKEYRNDEYGVRFGYLDGMSDPEDLETEDGTYVTTMTNSKTGTTVMLRIGKIDVSQMDIDHIEKQKESLTKELIKAETKIVEEVINGKIVQTTVVPEKVSDIKVTYALFADQLAVKFSYKENGLKATRILTIQSNYVYSLTYKADPDIYKTTEEEKIFNSFEFISKLSDVQKSELNTVVINDKEYVLPIKQSKFEGLTVDSKYVTQSMSPNYFTIVSLYELQEPKYSAYVYNAIGSVNTIGHGYVTAISTDINRGGNIKIYKGIEIGTKYSEVKELLGRPSRQYISEDDSTLTNIYKIEGVTIQLKFRNSDLSKPNDSSEVVSILLKVAI